MPIPGYQDCASCAQYANVRKTLWYFTEPVRPDKEKPATADACKGHLSTSTPPRRKFGRLDPYEHRACFLGKKWFGYGFPQGQRASGRSHRATLGVPRKRTHLWASWCILRLASVAGECEDILWFLSFFLSFIAGMRTMYDTGEHSCSTPTLRLCLH